MRVRSRPPCVAVTGAGRGLGLALVTRLALRDDLDGLVGVDVAPARVDGVVWRTADVRDPLLADRLRGAQVVVHLDTTYDVTADPVERRALNVRGTALLLEAARQAGAARVVLVTCASVYGAAPTNRVPLPDGAPLRAGDDDSLVGDHVEVERLAGHAARSGVAVTVLRPATLVGGPLGPAYDGLALRQLESPRLLAVRGVEPLWQLCHVDDLVSALELAAVGKAKGPATVACEGFLEQSIVEQVCQVRRLELPAPVALGTADRLHRLGVTAGSIRELDHLVGPLVVGSTALRKAGWAPAWTNEQALRAHLASRQADQGRSSAYTAAGATVAVLGAAALVRARRRRRGR